MTKSDRQTDRKTGRAGITLGQGLHCGIHGEDRAWGAAEVKLVEVGMQKLSPRIRQRTAGPLLLQHRLEVRPRNRPERVRNHQRAGSRNLKATAGAV